MHTASIMQQAGSALGLIVQPGIAGHLQLHLLSVQRQAHSKLVSAVADLLRQPQNGACRAQTAHGQERAYQGPC